MENKEKYFLELLKFYNPAAYQRWHNAEGEECLHQMQLQIASGNDGFTGYGFSSFLDPTDFESLKTSDLSFNQGLFNTNTQKWVLALPYLAWLLCKQSCLPDHIKKKKR